MNERIQALIEQCKHTSTTYFDGRGNVTETYFDKEKFAEMIVRECVKVCESRVGNRDYNTGRMHCVSDLKEHFGVE